jgi:hypothetical protein
MYPKKVRLSKKLGGVSLNTLDVKACEQTDDHGLPTKRPGKEKEMNGKRQTKIKIRKPKKGVMANERREKRGRRSFELLRFYRGNFCLRVTIEYSVFELKYGQR